MLYVNGSPFTDFLIGRTEYSVMIYDSRNSQGGKAGGGPGGGPMGKSWNVTFYDYSSSLEGSGEVGPDYGKRAFIARTALCITQD